MAYDQELAARVRQIIAEDFPELGAEITERAMFGGLAFQLRGHMAVAVGRDGEMMLRCSRDDTAQHLSNGATPTVMGARTMTGWVDVAGEQTSDDDRLTSWVHAGMTHAATLPPKNS